MTRLIPNVLEFDQREMVIRNVIVKGELRVYFNSEGVLTLDTTRVDFYPLRGELRYLPLVRRKP